MFWETIWTTVQSWGPGDWFLILAFVFGIPSFLVYLFHELMGTTRPHPLTWFLWLVTMVITTIVAHVGEGGQGNAYNVFYCFCIATILVTSLVLHAKEYVISAAASHRKSGDGFLCAVRYYRLIAAVSLVSIVRDIKKYVSRRGPNDGESTFKQDAISVGICLSSVAVWVVFNKPAIAAGVVTGVDGYSFRWTFRKAYREPWSESVLAWGLSVPNIIFTALAMEQYNFLTWCYPVTMAVITTALVVVCLTRRRVIPKPQLQGEF